MTQSRKTLTNRVCSNLLLILTIVIGRIVAANANTAEVTRLDIDDILLSKFQTKVVEGVAAEDDAFPTIVFLEITTNAGTGFCGGSIISSTHVLTAAHCLQGSVQKIDVWAGGEDIRNRSTFTLHQANGYLNHPFYTDLQLVSDIDEQSRNDIAVVQVVNAFPQAPATISEDPNGETGSLEGIVAGWGLEDLQNDPSVGPLLKFAEVVIISDSVCEDSWVNSPITGLGEVRPGGGTICTTDPTGNSGPCQGDSGGPLYVNGVVVGLTSYGIGCGDILPGVYTRVSSYICWLQELGIPNIRSTSGPCPATAVAPTTGDSGGISGTSTPEPIDTATPSPVPALVSPASPEMTATPIAASPSPTMTTASPSTVPGISGLATPEPSESP